MRESDCRGEAEFCLPYFVSPLDGEPDFSYVMRAAAYAVGWEGSIESYYPHDYLNEAHSGMIKHSDGRTIVVSQFASSLDRSCKMYRVSGLPRDVSENHVAIAAPIIFDKYLAKQTCSAEETRLRKPLQKLISVESVDGLQDPSILDLARA